MENFYWERTVVYGRKSACYLELFTGYKNALAELLKSSYKIIAGNR